MQAFKEIGWARACKYFFLTLIMLFFPLCLFPPLRRWFLLLLGAQIGNNVVINKVRFFNIDRKGFKGLKIGNNCFIGDECLLDLAESIELEDYITLAERVTVLTHMNVGYQDHPLQKTYPSVTQPVKIEQGCFVGACATILTGVTIGRESLVGANSLVNKSISAHSVVAGVPAKQIK